MKRKGTFYLKNKNYKEISLTPKNQILNDQLKKVETSEGSKTVTNKKY